MIRVILILLAIATMLATTVYASFEWFLASVILSPVMAAALLSFLSARRRPSKRTCPRCTQAVNAAAGACHRCGQEL